jgi:hypothetical protein
MMNVHCLKQIQAVGGWLVATALLITLSISILVPLAVAEPEQIDITLNANGHQTFDSLMQRAEVEASRAILLKCQSGLGLSAMDRKCH